MHVLEHLRMMGVEANPCVAGDVHSRIRHRNRCDESRIQELEASHMNASANAWIWMSPVLLQKQYGRPAAQAYRRTPSSDSVALSIKALSPSDGPPGFATINAYAHLIFIRYSRNFDLLFGFPQRYS